MKSVKCKVGAPGAGPEHPTPAPRPAALCSAPA